MSFEPVLNEGDVMVWEMSIYNYEKMLVFFSLANNHFQQHE